MLCIIKQFHDWPALGLLSQEILLLKPSQITLLHGDLDSLIAPTACICLQVVLLKVNGFLSYCKLCDYRPYSTPNGAFKRQSEREL